MSRCTRHMPTVAVYDVWASTYDSDGNMLQKMDDLELTTLMPSFLSLITSTASAAVSPLRILDLGCGTGRNTQKLLSHNWSGRNVEIIGLDASEGMLGVAREKLQISTPTTTKLNIIKHDFIPLVSLTDPSWPHSSTPDVPAMPDPSDLARPVDAVVSTLVLEQLSSIKLFFSAIAQFLAVGGVALVTNMHKDMGDAGGAAGFVVKNENGKEGQKVRGSSYLYSVEETLEAASGEGLEVVSGMVNGGEGNVEGVKEMGVTEELLGTLGERAKKWRGIRVWYGFVVRKVRRVDL
ncbi:hypothetical protein MKZ38_008562 [Zalerion maritima]|uniref:Methyltransferase type 12 domain-containing protein n=1 Tax=Zalerion maritima TaxID=339359 RepID=A0AAD5RW48_9PEZI|nr:hypothetical protein MKZ38_008562 [Zalerion maritima]